MLLLISPDNWYSLSTLKYFKVATEIAMEQMKIKTLKILNSLPLVSSVLLMRVIKIQCKDITFRAVSGNKKKKIYFEETVDLSRFITL